MHSFKLNLVLFFTIGTIFSSFPINAALKATLANCVINTVCEYTPRYSTNSSIVSRVKIRHSFINKLRDEEGFLSKDGSTNIILMFKDQKQLDTIIKEILLLDRYEISNDIRNINLELKIYEMNSSAFSEFNFQAEMSKKNAANSGIPEIASNIFKSILKIGNLDFTSIISMKKIVENSKRVYTKNFSVNNNGDILLDEQKQYLTATNIEIIKWQAGVKLTGKAQITTDTSNNEYIQLSGLDLFYGQPIFKTANKEEILTVDVTNEKRRVVNLKLGETIVLTSIKDSNEGGNSTGQILGYGHGSNNDVKYRIITISAPNPLQNNGSPYKKFSSQQISKMDNRPVSLKQVLNSIHFSEVKVLNNGSRKMTFRLDKSLARATNIKKDIEINISGAVKVHKTLKVENLMLTGFSLPEIPTSKLGEDQLKINVKLRSIKRKGFGYSRTRTYKKFIYNPLNNEFFE